MESAWGETEKTFCKLFHDKQSAAQLDVPEMWQARKDILKRASLKKRACNSRISNTSLTERTLEPRRQPCCLHSTTLDSETNAYPRILQPGQLGGVPSQ